VCQGYNFPYISLYTKSIEIARTFRSVKGKYLSRADSLVQQKAIGIADGFLIWQIFYWG
jgi:hypothetical protein